MVIYYSMWPRKEEPKNPSFLVLSLYYIVFPLETGRFIFGKTNDGLLTNTGSLLLYILYISKQYHLVGCFQC